VLLFCATCAAFLPRDAMHKRGICRHVVSVCLSVRPSFRLSVRLSRSWIMSKGINISCKFFSPSGSHTILVFPYQTGWRYSDGNPPNGGVECRRNIRHKLRFWSKIAVRAKCQKHLSATKLCIWHSRPRTTGYRSIAERANYEVTKQLPTTMQCRSHSRRRTSECLFATACSMDQYAEEKRTEKNLIVRSSISEAETTNNKRLRSTFCIEAIQTRSIARPLCDSRAFCSLYGKLHNDANMKKRKAWAISNILFKENDTAIHL